MRWSSSREKGSPPISAVLLMGRGEREGEGEGGTDACKGGERRVGHRPASKAPAPTRPTARLRSRTPLHHPGRTADLFLHTHRGTSMGWRPAQTRKEDRPVARGRAAAAEVLGNGARMACIAVRRMRATRGACAWREAWSRCCAWVCTRGGERRRGAWQLEVCVRASRPCSPPILSFSPSSINDTAPPSRFENFLVS